LYTQVEQFHTVVKGLARGPRNTIASIRNHYMLLVNSNFTRIAAPLDWMVKARDSTAAGYAARAPSANKKDLFVSPKGKGKDGLLDADDLLQIQEVWGRTNAEYGDFRARYIKFTNRLPRAERTETIADWKGPLLLGRKKQARCTITEEEKAWQKMDGKIKVLPPTGFLCVCTHAHIQARILHEYCQ
jgi:hypothetical protein